MKVLIIVELTPGRGAARVERCSYHLACRECAESSTSFETLWRSSANHLMAVAFQIMNSIFCYRPAVHN